MFYMIAYWAVMTVVLWVIQLLTYPLAPIAVSQMDDVTARLPRWARWMETHDNLGWEGPTSQDATAKWIGRYYPYGPDIAMTLWLWRNKAYTFRENVAGIKGLVIRSTIREWGREGDAPRTGFSYRLIVLETTAGRTYFELRPTISLFYFRLFFRIGWKLSGIPSRVERGQVDFTGTSRGIFTGITPRSGSFS